VTQVVVALCLATYKKYEQVSVVMVNVSSILTLLLKIYKYDYNK